MELIVKNLSKRFGEKLILDRLSLSIESGEFISLVGSSGSGKSTILRLIAGLEHPSSGSISVDGTPVSGPGPDRGMVFQKYSLYPWLNAAANEGLLHAAAADEAHGDPRTHGVLS